jgi:hypothetical protein
VADDGEDKPIPTVRRSCTLAAVSLRRLKRLKVRGSHGTSVAAIMTTFIEAGLREANEKRYIRFEDDPDE